MTRPSHVVLAALLLMATQASAAEPDGALAVLAGGASNLAGFLVGGADARDEPLRTP